MGKEADASRRGSDRAAYGGGAEEGEPVAEWVEGIPCADELMPLSQPLITPELASAFGITPEPTKTILDVYRASEETMGALCGKGKSAGVLLPSDSPSVLRKFLSLAAAREDDAPVAEEDDVAVVVGKDGVDESSPRKARRLDDMASTEEGEPGGRPEDESVDDPLARTLKRPRLVWTAQLHKRFVDVIAHLGIKNAVPRAIMQLMNVEGLTRENVASHLQKYRLYLKRMQGLSDEGPSSSDQLFASTPVPPSLHEAPVPVPVPYPAPPAMIPLPVYGLPQHGHGGQMGMMHINGQVPGGVHYTGIVSRHPYAMFGQPADWSGRNNFGTMTSHPSRVTPNDR